MQRAARHGFINLDHILLAVALLAFAVAAAQTWRLARSQLHAADLRSELQSQRRQAAEDRARATAAAASAAAAYRSLEQAWITKHQEIALEAQAQARRAAAAAADARVAGDGLRIRAHQLAATAACPAATNPTAASSGPPTTSPATVLANVLERLETAGRELAAIADARGTAGAACEKAYQALLTKP
jgi:hypothetical protein